MENTTQAEDVNYIREHLPEKELLVQLAEEADELAKAALKLRRTIDNVNPTPVTYNQAIRNVLEEFGDVHACLDVLGYFTETRLFLISRMVREKIHRWATRISAARDGNNPKT